MQSEADCARFIRGDVRFAPGVLALISGAVTVETAAGRIRSGGVLFEVVVERSLPGVGRIEAAHSAFEPGAIPLGWGVLTSERRAFALGRGGLALAGGFWPLGEGAFRLEAVVFRLAGGSSPLVRGGLALECLGQVSDGK